MEDVNRGAQGETGSSVLPPSASLTPSEHEGALALAVVIVRVLGAEVRSVDH